jgi:hypothetical protein
MEPLDYLGMELLLSTTRIHLSMESYILQTVALLQLDDLCKNYVCPHVPMSGPIDPDSPELPSHMVKLFLQGSGCLGWLVETGRPDVCQAHSRISQKQARPTAAAWEALKHVFHYLYGARRWCLSCPTHSEDKDLFSMPWLQSQDSESIWEFYVDSDFAGNTDPDVKRKSQIGIIALQNGFPVFWSSKVSSVAFADSDIVSSGAAEVYAAGNCTYDFLHLAHVAEEMNIDFPRPSHCS